MPQVFILLLLLLLRRDETSDQDRCGLFPFRSAVCRQALTRERARFNQLPLPPSFLPSFRRRSDCESALYLPSLPPLSTWKEGRKGLRHEKSLPLLHKDVVCFLVSHSGIEIVCLTRRSVFLRSGHSLLSEERERERERERETRDASNHRPESRHRPPLRDRRFVLRARSPKEII